MTATTFNPLAAARDLEAAGIERRQESAPFDLHHGRSRTRIDDPMLAEALSYVMRGVDPTGPIPGPPLPSHTGGRA